MKILFKEFSFKEFSVSSLNLSQTHPPPLSIQDQFMLPKYTLGVWYSTGRWLAYQEQDSEKPIFFSISNWQWIIARVKGQFS